MRIYQKNVTQKVKRMSEKDIIEGPKYRIDEDDAKKLKNTIVSTKNSINDLSKEITAFTSGFERELRKMDVTLEKLKKQLHNTMKRVAHEKK